MSGGTLLRGGGGGGGGTLLRGGGGGTKFTATPYLAPEEEDELIGYLRKASQLGYGKTRRQVKEIVERVATTNGILHSESISDGWWKRFLQRHGNIALRSGNATAHVRMKATNKENIKYYFKLLKEIFDTNNFAAHPERVYNMDESGMPLDPKPPKVVSLKGQKKVIYHTSGEKGQIMVLGCRSGPPTPLDI